MSSASVAITMAAALGFAAAAPAVAENKPIARIPFTLQRGTVTVPLSINGSPELPCILDTGMPLGIFLFDPAVGDRLGLEYVTTAAVTGSGPGARNGKIASGARARLGGAEFTGQRAIVMAERHEIADAGVDAVIGETVFARYVVEIDHESRTVSLYEPKSFVAPPAASSFAVRFAGDKPVIDAKLVIAGGDALAVTLMLDTGASGTLSLNSKEGTGLQPPSKTIATILGAGIAGDIAGVRGRVEALQLGPHVLKGVIADFPQPVARNDRDGTLGMGVLRRFKITLDYPHDRVLLEPNKTFGEPFEANMAGLVLRAAGKDRLRVHGVIAESSAAKAGILSGDVITAIDGEAPAAYDEVERAFRRDGATVRLSLERAGQRLDRAVLLVRAI